MTALKYTIIKSEAQYEKYCNILEDLIMLNDPAFQDEIDMVTLLIEKWDSEHNFFDDKNPIELLNTLMTEHALKAKDLSEILGLSKGTISKILNYHKGLSKETIRKLSDHFKISQEAFNRPYELFNETNKRLRSTRLRNKDKGKVEAG